MIRCIDALLERVDTDAAVGIEEAFFFGALLDVDLDDLIDHIGHVRLGEGWAEDLRQAGVTAGAAAERYLIELLAFLVDAEDADVADVVVAAGVHAAGNVQVDVADVEQVVQIIETTLDGFGDRDRLGVGQRAEVAARAADDVGQQAHVRRGEALFAQLTPQGQQLTLLDVGEDDVLGDDAVEALDEAGVVSGEGGELRVHALPWGVLQQGLLLVSSETKTKYKYLTF